LRVAADILRLRAETVGPLRAVLTPRGRLAPRVKGLEERCIDTGRRGDSGGAVQGRLGTGVERQAVSSGDRGEVRPRSKIVTNGAHRPTPLDGRLNRDSRITAISMGAAKKRPLMKSPPIHTM